MISHLEFNYSLSYKQQQHTHTHRWRAKPHIDACYASAPSASADLISRDKSASNPLLNLLAIRPPLRRRLVTPPLRRCSTYPNRQTKGRRTSAREERRLKRGAVWALSSNEDGIQMQEKRGVRTAFLIFFASSLSSE